MEKKFYSVVIIIFSLLYYGAHRKKYLQLMLQ